MAALDSQRGRGYSIFTHTTDLSLRCDFLDRRGDSGAIAVHYAGLNEILHSPIPAAAYMRGMQPCVTRI